MRIGIDIDNTITETTEIIMAYARKYGERHQLNTEPDYREYYIEDAFGWPRETADAFLNGCLLDIYRDVKPKPGALNTMREINHCHSLILITSRNRFFPGIETATREWLARYEIPFESLVMNSTANMHHFSKVQACQENRVEVMVEDHHELAFELSQHVPVLLFDYPYNRHIHSPNICRVKTWEEVGARIKDMNNIAGQKNLA
ncbi:MAG TPA: hypothetical protein VN426_11675 [Syntrophomonadaceae bacterium]|nr:hypothetical protein [Syntrophomonadaceae bacterium]